jgi:large subunit ribosomal protein L10
MAPSDTKKKIVEDLRRLLDESPVIGAVNMENLPAKQLQQMVASLRGKMILKVAKRRLIKIALEKSSKKNIKDMEQYLKGMPALMFSKENPFKLYKTLEKSKSTAPAKAGQTAPKDIVVPAGPTSFAPGPIIGELGAAGIKAGIEDGKVAIKEDSVVAKEGDVISQEIAGVLTRLGVEPMEIGMNIVAMYENGGIFTKDILSVDESKYISDIENTARIAFNMSLDIGYITKDNIQHLVTKTFNESKNLAISEDLITDLTLGNTIGKAESQMKNLANKLNLPDKEDKKMEEPKKEEKEKKEEPQEQSEESQKKEEEVREEKSEEVKEERKEESPSEESKEENKVEETEEKVTENKEEEIKEETSTEEKVEDKKTESEEEIEQKDNEKTEESLQETKEEEIESKKEITDDDMKKAEENLKKIQEQIQKK